MKPTDSSATTPSIEMAYFAVDGGPLYQGYHVASMRWNGWATPMFELEVAKKIALDTFDEDYHVKWIEEKDAFELVDNHYDDAEPWFFKAETVMVNGEEKKVFGIGSGFWCWDDYDNIEDRPSDSGGIAP